MFPHTMTIYHKKGETWSRSVISGVMWQDLVGIVMRKTGIKPTDKAQVYIPMTHKISIAEGDIIMKGVCDKVIDRSSKEIPEGLMVTMVEVYDFGGTQKHWRVTAK